LLHEYEQSLHEIVELSMRRGVIPVLSTVTYNPVNPDIAEAENAIIRQVAAEYQVPLWDLYATTYGMPNHGIDNTTAHLTITPDAAHFSDEGMISQYGIVRRNLEALEVLHAIYTQVMGY
jgi:lysophospholipase L1-like esterase